MNDRPESDAPRSGTHRTVTALFGVGFVVLAIWIALSAGGSMTVAAVAAALALGLLGVDACASAVRGKRSLLQRIGPLP